MSSFGFLFKWSTPMFTEKNPRWAFPNRKRFIKFILKKVINSKSHWLSTTVYVTSYPNTYLTWINRGFSPASVLRDLGWQRLQYLVMLHLVMLRHWPQQRKRELRKPKAAHKRSNSFLFTVHWQVMAPT